MTTTFEPYLTLEIVLGQTKQCSLGAWYSECPKGYALHDISKNTYRCILSLAENIGMSNHPETAEDNTHPTTNHGIQLQTPFTGR